MREFSALVTCRGPESGAPPEDEMLTGVVERLPGTDKWAQYPDASGRGHAVEFRFWVQANDAADAALNAHTMVTGELSVAGLADWKPDRVHIATVEERVLSAVQMEGNRP